MMKSDDFKNKIFVWDDLYDYFVKADNPQLEEAQAPLDYFGPFRHESESDYPFGPFTFPNFGLPEHEPIKMQEKEIEITQGKSESPAQMTVEKDLSLENQQDAKMDLESKVVPIPHLIGGQTIFVSKRRHDRIMKRRPHLMHFLLANPRLTKPYCLREEKAKCRSRMVASKTRMRYKDGKFIPKQDYDVFKFVQDHYANSLSITSGRD